MRWLRKERSGTSGQGLTSRGVTKGCCLEVSI